MCLESGLFHNPSLNKPQCLRENHANEVKLFIAREYGVKCIMKIEIRSICTYRYVTYRFTLKTFCAEKYDGTRRLIWFIHLIFLYKKFPKLEVETYSIILDTIEMITYISSNLIFKILASQCL